MVYHLAPFGACTTGHRPVVLVSYPAPNNKIVIILGIIISISGPHDTGKARIMIAFPQPQSYYNMSPQGSVIMPAASIKGNAVAAMSHNYFFEE